MSAAGGGARLPSICLLGLGNLPVLAPEYAHIGAGGAELQQMLLARALVRRGFPVSTIVYDLGQPDGACWDGIRALRSFRPQAGVPLLRFLHPRMSSVWRALVRANADICYVSCAGAFLGAAALYARIKRRKLIYRVASDSDCDPRTLLIRYRRDRLLYAYGLRRADLVLAQTPAQQGALERNFGVASRLAPPLMEPAAPARALSGRDVDVLWIGNLRALKRPERVLELAAALPRLRFHMVGGAMPGAEALFESTRARAQGLANVHFHGRLPQAAVAELLSRSRLLAGTSDTEGFPNTYLQAWAHGVPVVAFLDPERLIERHGLGSVVASLPAMQAAVTSLLADTAAWQAASERCRRYIERRLDEPALLGPYLQAFADLYAGSSAGSAHGRRVSSSQA